MFKVSTNKKAFYCILDTIKIIFCLPVCSIELLQSCLMLNRAGVA